jgi:methylmalonyl-CoA/ethylmalonyl-CoA epimerase
MMRKIDHLGIVVRDLDAALAHWAGLLGVEAVHREVVADQGVEVAKFPVGESSVELITPVKEGTGIAKFLEKRGEGIHHVCYAVPDLAAELSRLAASGVALIDETPRIGAGGDLIAFLHPKSTNGVLTELKQMK